MGFTTSDLQAIERAIATGERIVRIGERLIEYRSVEDLLKARDAIKAELDKPPGGSTDAQRRYSRVIFSRGRE
jgi:hypothetical protein